MKEATESAAADLVTPELFASSIGKTPAAVRRMAQEGKLPVIRMRDPAKPEGKGELYIMLAEWNNYARHLVSAADAEWHAWKDRLSTEQSQWNPGKGKADDE